MTPRRARKLRRRKRRSGVESRIVHLAAAVIPRLSRTAMLRLARVLGSLGYIFDVRSRRVSLENLGHVLPELSDTERRRIARESVITFARSTLELFWFSRDPESRIAAHLRCDASVNEMWDIRPTILLASHFGNFELPGLYSATRGRPPTSVYQPSGNPEVDRVIRRMRERTGMIVLPNKNVIRPLLRTIKEGGSPALLIDQNTEPHRGGIFVDFFGLPVPNSSAVAAMAIKTGAPVVPAYCRLTADDQYILYVSPPIYAQEGDTTQSLTQRFADDLEREVRAHPTQWAWSYKRWKFVPDGDELSRYPSYARQLGERERGHVKPAKSARGGAGPHTEASTQEKA